MSWNDKLVSVILLVYNSAEQLPRALASVFAQDYPRLEIIVTDDGSEEFDAEEFDVEEELASLFFHGV